MNGNKTPLLTDEESTQLDSYALNYSHLSEDSYMGMASVSIFQTYRKTFKDYDILVLAGSGNNGGDGIALANLFHQNGNKVKVYQKNGNYSNTYNIYNNLIKKAGIDLYNLENLWSYQHDESPILIIDSLLGTGSRGKPFGVVQKAIDWIHLQKKRNPKIQILSIDTPSGFEIGDDAISVIPDYLAEVGSKKIKNLYARISIKGYTFHPIGFPLLSFSIDQKIDNFLSEKISSKKIRKLIERKKDSHKYKNGSALFIGGSENTNGAIFLSCKAFHSVGGGISKIYSPSSSTINMVRKNERSFMVQLYDKQLDDQSFIDKSDSIVIGPGLRKEDIPTNLQALLNLNKFTILDAGILDSILDYNLHEKTILTPHDGELNKMAGIKFQNLYEKLNYLKKTCISKNTNILLKGPITIHTNPKGISNFYFNPNPVLATMGTGDLLSGYLAQFIIKFQNVETGVSYCMNYFKNVKKFKIYPTADNIIESLRGDFYE